MSGIRAGLFLVVLSASASADLTDWANAVNAGFAPAFVEANLAIPAVKDFGTITSAQGATYEIIVNATNSGISSALMGAKGTGVGNEAALKFEQWPDTLSFGVTQWGVADYTIAPNTENADLHVVFVSDSINNMTLLYVDGAMVGTAPFAPWLTGLVGIGEWYDPGFPVDPLTGTVLGVAVYDGMLSAAEIQAHSDAFHDVGLGTSFCATAPNSTGSPALMSAEGSASVAANDLVLLASPVATGEPGIFYYGPLQIQVPFGDGFRCIGGSAGSIIRIFPFAVGDATGTMELALDNTLPAHAQIVAGASLNFQAWYRDPAAGLSGFNLSDGLAISFQP